MYANVRETGTEISWHGCDFTELANAADDADTEPGSIGNEYTNEYTCNTLDDLEEMNCKRFSSEKSECIVGWGILNR